MRHHSRQRSTIAAWTVVTVLAAAGCLPAGPDPTVSPTPSATTPAASADPTLTLLAPTSSPTPDDSDGPATAEPGEPDAPDSTAAPDVPPAAGGDDLDCPAYDDGLDWSYVAIDSHRYGAICTGMTFAEADAAVPGPPIEGHAECPWVAPVVEADPLYVSAISDPDDPTGPIRFFRLQYLADPATAPPHEVPSTAEGGAIGALKSDLAAAYPDADYVTQEDPSYGPRDQMVVAEAPGHWYVFDFHEDVVSEMTWGQDLGGGIAGELCAL